MKVLEKKEDKLKFKRKSQKKNKLHKILITVLIPLLFGILLTTVFSILLILLLSQYWTDQGVNSLAQQQYVFQTSMATILGKTQEQIFQKYSTIRSQILSAFWFQQSLVQYCNLKTIQVPQVLSLYSVISQQTLSNIYYYDPNTNQCLYCLGWGIVDESNILSIVNDVDSLSLIQYQQLQQITSTFAILQVLYNSNFEINYIYYHFDNLLFVQYPILNSNGMYANSPLQKMKQQFIAQNMTSAFFVQSVSEAKSQIDSCVSLLNNDLSFFGVMCLGITTLGQQVFLNNLFEKIQYQGYIYSFYFNQNLSIFTTNLYNQYVDEQKVISYGYPSLYTALFNNQATAIANFLKQFQNIVYPSQESQYIELISQISSNIYTVKQVIQNEFESFVNTTINPLFQLSGVLLCYDVTYYESFLDFMSSGIENQTFQNIMTIALPISFTMCIIAWYISYRIIQSVSKPLNDLTHKLELVLKLLSQISQDTLAIQIYSNFRQSSFEVNSLYDSFDQLVTVLNFSNDRYFEGDDTTLLIKYAQGKALFQKMKSNKGMGMILNNIGNIHRRQKRYFEAIQCYRESILCCDEDLKENQDQWKSREFNIKSVLIYRNMKDSPNQQVIEYHQLKEKYKPNKWKIFIQVVIFHWPVHLCNDFTNFSEFADSSTSLGHEEKKLLYKESLECLNITLSMDQKETRSLLYRQIISRILLCKVLLNLDDSNQALAEINNAEQLSDKYEAVYERLEQNTNDSFTIPPGILKQRILYEKGLFIKKYDSLKKAAFIFTECLETSKFYDPEIRVNCLKQLKSIFQQQNLLAKVPKIDQLLALNERKKNNDIIFVIDHSGSMENIKKELAINGILKIFDNYLQDQDRIGFMRFNQNIEVVFDLTNKSENTAYLRSAIERTKNLEAQGMSGMLSAILHSYSIHDKAVKKDNQRWIVVLCDGEDNLSNITYEQMKKYTSKRKDISLIIIGIGLSLKPDSLEELFDLCRLTQNGFLIESVYSEDLDIAFQSISNLIFGTSSIYDERLN